MKKETHDSLLIINRATGEWLNELILDFSLEESLIAKYGEEKAKIYSNLAAAKDYISEPEKYDVVFRECSYITDATLREAYDLAQEHPDDNYYYQADWMLTDEFIQETAKDFMEQLTEEIVYYEDDCEDKEDAWDEYAQDFFWARRLNADEERDVREKYGI